MSLRPSVLSADATLPVEVISVLGKLMAATESSIKATNTTDFLSRCLYTNELPIVIRALAANYVA